MKILIVDDEAPARLRLRSLTEALEEHEVVGEAGHGAEAVEACAELNPDLVLMDVRMPGMDGLAAAARISQNDNPPAIIFVTAYDEYALAAFESEAVDYLLKPVRRERLAAALKKATRLNRAQLEALSRDDKETGAEEPAHLLCRRHNRLELIPIETVHCLQADQKYVTVYHAEGEDLIEDSLKRLESAFPDRFIRVHRNALVARDALGALEKGPSGYRVRVRPLDLRLDVSRRHVSELRSLLRRLAQ